MQKKRNTGLDVIKGFAALLVCMLHFLHVDFGEVIPGETYFPNLTKIFYGLCACSVPIFFYVNGYLVGCRQYEHKTILTKILNLLKLRIIVGTLIGVIVSVILGIPHSFENYMIITSCLWFFEALLVIWVWMIVWDKIKNYRWSIVFPIMLFIVPFLTNFFGLIATLLGYTLPEFFGHYGLFRLYGLLYFMLPFYTDRKVFPRVWAIVAVIAGFLEIVLEVFVWSNSKGFVYDGMNACFPTIGALLMTLGFFSIFTTVKYNDENPIVKYFAWLGTNCLGVYLLNLPIIMIINKYVLDSDMPVLCAIAVCFAIVTFCSLIYSWLLKFKYVNYLFKI